MSESKIEIVDARPAARTGFTIMDALVGPSRELFEIREVCGEILYTVRERVVSKEVYLAALATASVDRFDSSDPEYQRRESSESEGD